MCSTNELASRVVGLLLGQDITRPTHAQIDECLAELQSRREFSMTQYRRFAAMVRKGLRSHS